jgi:NADH-quinone oxidoreductase subunit N
MNATALSLPVILPEFILAFGVLVLILLGALRGERSVWLVTEGAVALLGVALVVLLVGDRPEGVTFYGAFTDDAFARFMKALALIGSLATLLLSIDFMRSHKIGGFEFPVLLLLGTLGMMMLISATDFIALYLGLELMSLALYVVAAYRRDDLRSSEAGIKYFVLGALSSGMLLYGISLMYGYSGTISFAGVAAALKGPSPLGVVFGLVFVLAGLAFKISAVPFHMWTPDVYQGAPSPVTGFMAAVAKAGAFAAMLRVLFSSFGVIETDWRPIIYGLAVLSLVLGAFVALRQRDVKRMLAYSSINHAGFILLGVAAGTARGASASLYYLFAYMFMTVGSFAIVTILGREADTDHDLSRYRGLAGRQPVLALAFAVLLLAQAGAPFTTGLWAKLQVVFAAIGAGEVPLAVIAMVSAAVAAYFYLRVAVLMYAGGGLGEPEDGTGGSAELGAGGGMTGGGLITAAAPAATAATVAAATPGGNGGLAWATPAAAAGTVTTLNEQILLDDEADVAEDGERVPVPGLSALAIALCTGVTVLFGVWPQPLIDFANHATLLFLPH